MKTALIVVLIINCVVKTIGEDKLTAAATADNPTSSLESGVEGLVKIVHSFLETVQSEDFVDSKSGSISFSDVEEILKKNKFEDLSSRWRDLVAVFGGFAACVIIGLLFMLCMPLAGCITCCCFCCCKRCGKARSKEDPENAKCKRVTLALILFMFVILMLVGAIFAVISNEILHSKLENTNEQGPIGQVKSGLEDLVKFSTDTADELVKKANDTVDDTVTKLITEIRDSTSDTVNDIKATINATYLLDQVKHLGRNANESAGNLIKVQKEVRTLNDTGSKVKTRLDNIKTSIEANCPNTTPGCPDVSALALDVDFSQLNDLSEINNVVSAVQDITDKADMAEAEFVKVESKIRAKVNNTIQDAEKNTQNLKDDILREIPSAKQTLLNMTESLNITKDLNDADQELKKYGDYVWYAFIGFPCLILLVVMFYLLGLMFGMFGERPGQHAACCNKGAGSNLLCCGVTCSYLVGSLIMLVVIIMFIPTGLLYTNGCRYLNDGVENIEKFEFIINSTFGYNIAEFIDKDNPNITVGSILSNCKKDQSIYDAFHLDNLFSIDTILNMSKITAEIDKIVSQGSQTSLENITIIPSDLKDQLKKFADSGVDSIDFAPYNNVLNQNLTSYNLTKLSEDLHEAADAIKSNDSNKAAALRNESENLHNVSGMLKDIDVSRENLNDSLQHLKSQTNLTVQVQALIDSLTKAQDDFNTNSSAILKKSLKETAESLLEIVNTSITKIKTDIRTIGPCKAVYDNVQKLSNAFCVSVLDPLNSIWFGLGWGLAFFIPCIIFALCTANLYQREEPYDTSFHTTRKLLKKRNKEESTFDNPDIDMYQGQGYDAYNGQGADNIPLTGMRGDRVRSDHGGGVPNNAYHSPEHRNSDYNGHRNNGYNDHRNSGYMPNQRSSGYPYDHAPSSPPPYNGYDYRDDVHGRAKAYHKPQY